MEERYIDISVDDLLEVTLAKDDDFLKVKETLTRIGVSSRKENKLYQSCHILHKRGKYYIVHFKELFALDGLPTNLSDEDLGRRNTITNLLAEWELLKIVDSEQSEEPLTPINKIKILPYREKGDWELCPKYHIGKKK
jgi:hypothetical protein|tara:strand:+ start:214 stop:627 length:414 start_codon:yes stop_codon:yes gene_type:complete